MIDLVLEHIDALDDEGTGVIYNLSAHVNSRSVLGVRATYIQTAFEADHC